MKMQSGDDTERQSEQEQGVALGNSGPIVSITPSLPVTLLLLSFTVLIPNIHFI